jgi:hypothetical protein
MIASNVGCDNLHEASERVGVAMIEVAENTMVICAKLKICLLDQVVDGLLGRVAVPDGCSQDHLCNKAMKPADKLLPSGDFS